MTPRVEFLPADVLGLSPLARAALSGRLAPGLVRSTSELAPAPLERDPVALEERAELAARLEAAAAALEPPIGVLQGLRRLAHPAASLVLARRPAGLLAGPLATLHAGAAAVSLARDLERRWERPVVAALWLVDSGAERPGAWVLGRHHDLLRLSLDGLEGEAWPARTVLSRARHGLGALRAALAQLYGDHPRLAETLELLVPREGETLTGATARAVAGLLGAKGLVPLDPGWLRRELADGTARLAGVDHGSGESPPPDSQVGEAAAAERAGSAPAALHRGPGGADELVPGGEGFVSPRRPGSRTPAELAAAVIQDPQSWSPGPRWLGAALELVLPVGAHLLEAADLDHDRLRPGLLAGLGRDPRPAGLRAPVTVVEEEVRTSLERAGTTLEGALRAVAQEGSRGDQMRPKRQSKDQQDAADRLRGAGAEARRGLLASRADLARIDPGLAGQLARLARGLEGDLERLARRAERARANALGQDRRRARRIAHALTPSGRAQEEVLCPFAPLARHGAAWLESLTELEPLGAEHVVLHLDRAPDPGA